MKKLLTLFAFIALCGMLAAVNVLLVNYTFSSEGEVLMDEIRDYIVDSDYTELTNSEKPGDVCLFVKEYFVPSGMDPSLRSFSVSFAVVEKPFGDYSEFVPLDETVSRTWYVGTEAFLISANDMRGGIYRALDSIDTSLYLFLATYNNMIFKPGTSGWEKRVKALLEDYCAQAYQWFITPRELGGAGMELLDTRWYELSEFLGFDKHSGSTTVPEYEIIVGILYIKDEYIELGATTSMYSGYNTRLIHARVDLKNGEISID